MSVAVWVGLIALLGVDTETGVFMLLYLDLATDRAKAEGRLNDRADLRRAGPREGGPPPSPGVHDRGDDLHRTPPDPVVGRRRVRTS